MAIFKRSRTEKSDRETSGQHHSAPGATRKSGRKSGRLRKGWSRRKGVFRRSRISLMGRMRNSFLTGLIIVGPLVITIYIVWWFIDFVDRWAQPLIDSSIKPLMEKWVKPYFDQWLGPHLPNDFHVDWSLPMAIPGAGLIFMMIMIMLIGALAANLFGRSVVHWGEGLVGRMPIVRNLYKATKQIFETVLSERGTSFQKVGLIEYPRPGLFALVFISTETKGEINEKITDRDRILSVFLPTTPNPTSGFLLFVPREDVTVLDMTVEEGAKLVISAGLVVPDYQDRLQQMADQADQKADNSDRSDRPNSPRRPLTGKKADRRGSAIRDTTGRLYPA